ncbi:MAG: MFS transporter [Chloroflexaceae bacterium]|jgi:MFS family permease|nr:MFS transporter [Chloroflexaceae bacterium]
MNGVSAQASAARRVMPVLFIGVFMAALDVAIVAPALPLLRNVFEISNSQAALFMLVYSLCSLISTAPMASLSDRVGRRPVYLWCIVGFAFGSLLVALSPNFGVALLGRAIQGLSAGGVTPAASAVVGDVFPASQRGRALGLIGATFGIAFLIGPVLASLLLLVLSWHWLFLINLPVAALILVLGLRALPATHKAGDLPPFDLAGTLVGFVLLAALVLSINRTLDGLLGLTLWPWLLALALVCLPLLLWVERRAAQPLVPLAIFGPRQINLTYLLSLGAGFGMGSVAFVSVLAVVAYAVPEQQAGFLLIPLVLASTLGSMLSGRWLNNAGSRMVLLVGFVCMLAGGALLGLSGMGMAMFFLASSLLGAGVGIAVGGALRFIVLNESAASLRSTAQGLINIGTSIGNLVAVATLGAIADSQGGGLAGFASAYLTVAAVSALMLVVAWGLKSRQAERQHMQAEAAERADTIRPSVQTSEATAR